MVTHESRKWVWAIPITTIALTFVLGGISWYFGYTIDRELHHIDGKFEESNGSLNELRNENKADHMRMWAELVHYQDKMTCLEQKVSRCCHDDPTTC
jgi:hypothetical protein